MAKVSGWFRSKEKLILVGICSLLMVSWIIMPSLASLFRSRRGPAGEIFGREVSVGELRGLDVNLRTDQALQQVPGSAGARPWVMLMWSEEAKNCGITVSDEEVSEYLKARFPSSAQGGFDPGAYERLLSDWRVSAAEFESGIRTQLSAMKLMESIVNSVAMSTEEAWAWYARNRQQAKAAYIKLRAKDFMPLVTVTGKEMRDTYEAFADKKAESDEFDPSRPQRQRSQKDPFGRGYLQPRKYKIKYIMAPDEKYADEVLITERQVRAYYEKNKDRDYKLNPPGPAQDGSTDKSNKTSQPTYKPLADMAEGIEKKLRLTEARGVAMEVMAGLNQKVRRLVKWDQNAKEYTQPDLEVIAAEAGLQPRVTGFFAPRDPPKELSGALSLRSQKFRKGPKGLRDSKLPLSADDGCFIFQTLEIKPEEPAIYEAVKDKVGEHVRLKKAFEMVLEVAGKALQARDLDAAAKLVQDEIAAQIKKAPEKVKARKPEEYFTRGESKFFSRPTYRPPYWPRGTTGVSGEFNDWAFAVEAFNTQVKGLHMATLEPETPRVVLLFQRTEALPADRKEFDEKKDAIKRGFLRQKQTQVIQTWFENIVDRALPSESVVKDLSARR